MIIISTANAILQLLMKTDDGIDFIFLAVA